MGLTSSKECFTGLLRGMFCCYFGVFFPFLTMHSSICFLELENYDFYFLLVLQFVVCFLYFFKSLLLIFTQRFIRPAFCILVHYKIILLSSSLTVYQETRKCRLHLLITIEYEERGFSSSAIKEKRGIINHLY